MQIEEVSIRPSFNRLTRVVKRYGFTQSQTDYTMFINHSAEGKRAIIIVYVDDIILTGDHVEQIKHLRDVLAQEFEIKDLRQLRYFLRMEVACSHKGISTSQRKYTLDLLKETGKLGCKPMATPMDPTSKIQMEEDVLADKGRYQQLAGSISYLSHIRPDIGFAVGMISRYMNKPTEKHSRGSVPNPSIPEEQSRERCTFWKII